MSAQKDCRAPEPVCDAARAVFRINGFERFATAVRVSATDLVTTRRAVADREKVTIQLGGGKSVEAAVVPGSYAGDLVLIRARLPDGPVISIASKIADKFHVVGLDRATSSIEVFQKGGPIVPLGADRPGVHLQHNAATQPGSGGAVVDETGALIAIQLASTGSRSEAVPARQISALKAMSGAKHQAVSAAIGAAYRDCITLTGQAAQVGDIVPDNVVKKIVSSCLTSGARDLIERAGITLSKSRMQAKAAALFAKALEIDPNAIDAHIGRAMVFGIQGRHREALADAKWLMNTAPGDSNVQRISLQAAKKAGDKQLIDQILAYIAAHNPAALEAAKRFVGSDSAPLPQL